MTKKETELLDKYKKEYGRWYDALSAYHTQRFDKNYRQYTAYTETKGTKTKISDPVAPELIERVVQKLFEREPKFYSLSRGKNLPKEITNIIGSVAEYYWTNPEVVQSTGSRKSILKVIGREFCVTGNVAVESFFNGKADNPDFRVIPIEDVIFDPAKTLKTSPRYYVRQFVNIDYLKENSEVKKDGKVVKGLFKNIPAIENALTDDDTNKQDSTDNQINRSGTNSFEKQTGNLELVSVWTGKKLCQIIDWKHIIREVEDPMQIGDDPLDFAMDIEVPKQPYGFGILDFLNGLTTAKDLILNQVVDYGAKALNPPLFVDPSINPVNIKSLSNAYKLGGIVFATPAQASHQPMPAEPSIGFNLLNYIQQRAESTSGIGSYLGGVPNQTNDKTKGTKGGILALMEQAISPVKDRQINIEESIIEPVVNKWLKMAGALMGANEQKFVMLTGESQKWVQVTKGLLTGQMTLSDLMLAELVDSKEINPETGTTEADDIANMMLADGKDPVKDILFDTDWIVRVEAGSMAEVDKEQALESFKSATEAGMSMGVQLDKDKIWKEIAQRAGIKEPEQYLLTPEQLQQEQMQNQDPFAQGAQGGQPMNSQVAQPKMPMKPQMAKM